MEDLPRQCTDTFCFVCESVFFAKFGITILEHSPYLLDLASSHSFIFQAQFGAALKGTKFESVEAVIVKAESADRIGLLALFSTMEKL